MDFVSDLQLPIDDGYGSEVISDEASFYESNPTEISTTGVRAIKVSPITNIQGSTVYQFEFKSALNEVIDVKRIKLRLVFQIVKRDGNNIPEFEADNTTPTNLSKVVQVNSLGSAFFTGCQVNVNGTTIEGGDTMYAYKADIQNRLTHSKDVKANQLQLSGFTNEYCKWENLSDNEKDLIWTATAPNPSLPRVNPFIERYLRSKGSKKFTIETEIYADFFKEHKFLPPNTTLSIALTKVQHPETFCLLTDQNSNYMVKCISADLKVQLKLLDEDFVDVSINNFKNGAPYRTSYTTAEMIRYSSPQGLTDLGETDIFKLNSYSPNRFIIVFVDQKAFNGDKKSDPFNYKRHGVHYFALLRSDGNTRHLPVYMDRWDGDIDEGLANLYQALDLNTDPDESLGIDYFNFDLGNFFMAFDLQKTENPGVYSLPDKAVNTVEIKSAALENPIAKIVYAEFNTELIIDAYGNVTVRKNALA